MNDPSEYSSEEESRPILSQRTLGRRVADIHALSQDEKVRLQQRNKTPAQLREIETVVQQLIDEAEKNGGTLRGTGARKAAAHKLGVSVWTIDNYIERYKAAPRIESLIDQKRGPTPGRTFTQKQQEIIAYYYVNPKVKTIGSDGQTATVKGLEDVRYIQEVLAQYAPEPPHSNDSIRRFQRMLRRDQSLAVDLARHGEKYISSKVLPARRNDAEHANDRWQIDGRPLPIYIRHDGIVCTVTLLLIIDDLSQYPLRARLVPRMLRNEEGVPERTDFTAADVGIVVASTIYYSGVCPGTIYNDNGSQLIKIEEFLKNLSDENQAVVRMATSIPRRPRGRGKIENMLKLFDNCLKGLPGNLVGKEKDFDALREARSSSELISLEKLQTKCDEYIAELRRNPRRKGEKKTRQELWSEELSVRRAPPIRQLMHMLPERISRDTAIDYWHFSLNNEEYEPRLKNDEDVYRWMVAAARKEFVPLRAAKFDLGWECDICLDRDDAYWCEGILKTKHYLKPNHFPEMLGKVLSRAKREHATMLNELTAIAKAIGLDNVYKHDITNKPIKVEARTEKPASDNKTDSTSFSNLSPKPEREPTVKDELPRTNTNVSVRTASPRKPSEPTGRKFDWNSVPKADEVWQRVEGDLEKGNQST